MLGQRTLLPNPPLVLFPVRSRARDRLRDHLAAEGIGTLIRYPIPIPRQPALAASNPATCPIADAVCDEIVSLPLHPGLREADVGEVAAAVASFRFRDAGT